MEAGHGANIIMGVGDDEALDDSISVTVIATGFDAEQQNDIVNTETRKIIHSLSDEQRVEQRLSAVNTGNVVIPEMPITKHPVTPVEPKEEVIRHNLFEEKEEVTPPAPIKKEPLFIPPTTDFIKNLEVNDPEEVIAFTEAANEDDFVIINAQEIINEIEVNDEERISFEEKVEDPDQMAFTFDLPLTKDIKAIEVAEYDEISPIAKKVEEELPEVEKAPSIVRYQLEDCLLYTSPSPRDQRGSRMPSSA